MPIRFRRTLKVGPGVKLNFSKSGVSTTVGPKGFHFTFGKRGVRRTVSIPGTGVSEVDYIKKNETEEQKEKRKEKAEEKREQQVEARKDEKESAVPVTGAHRTRRAAQREIAQSSGSRELRNAFVLLGLVVFFFVGANMMGFVPPHFYSNSVQFLAHVIRSSGH